MTCRSLPQQHWELAALGDLFDILDSQRVPVNARERANRPGRVPYFGATGQIGWIDDFLFDEEVVLLGEDGAPFLQAGKPKAYVVRGRSWVNNHAHVLRALAGSPSLFWKYQLDQVDYGAFVSGTTRLKLSQAPMRRIHLLVPPLQEQRRIVDVLDSCFTRLDVAEAALKRAQVNLNRHRTSVLKAAVEGRLVPTEAELARREGRDYEPASALLERILAGRRSRWEEAELARMKSKGRLPKDDLWKSKYKRPVAPDTSALPDLPEGWCWTSIGQLFDVLVGSTPSRAISSYWGGTIPWVSSGEVAFCRIQQTRECITEEGLAKSTLRLNPPGTVLIGMIGEGKTRGQTAILDISACNNQNAAAIRVADADQSPEYVYYYLMRQYENTRRMGSGGNQPALNRSRVEAILLPLPPRAEQVRIASELDRRLSLEDHLQYVNTVQSFRLQRLRQSILKWAFEGRLVDQDPTDEPASVLLERIKAQRQAEAPSRQRGRGRGGRRGARSAQGNLFRA